MKPTNESGGYGIFIGPQASEAEREACRAQVLADPRNFVAQPVLFGARHAPLQQSGGGLVVESCAQRFVFEDAFSSHFDAFFDVHKAATFFVWMG